ncbi:MAG: ABC transporter ATP-binding protein, partial [Clostridia bacterium]|nr:ABC transporter ATP-binding protein [Clostridia bacterium]
SIPVFKKIQSKLDRIMLLTRENLSGVRVIRAFNREEKEEEEFNETASELQKLQIFAGRISALLNPVTYVILNLAIAVLISNGAGSVNAGVLTQGAVVALVNYMSQILVELIKLSNLIVTMNKASACLKRVNTVLNEKPSMEYPEKSGEPKDSPYTVEFKDVDFYYSRSKEPSLEKISFKITKGMTVGIIGATGFGKSTLVNLIPRFYDCTNGEVLLFGQNVKNYAKEDINNLVAVVPQKSVLFKGSLKDNIRLGKEDAGDEEILKAISIAQGDDIIKVKGGIDFEIEQDGKNLSGGQKQRIAIARALVKNAPVLILDDSMSALDFATDARLRAALKESQKDATVFIVSQRASTVKNADVIIVLDDGRLAGIGTDKELFESCDEYREICLSQSSDEEAKING